MPLLSIYEGYSELSFCAFRSELDSSDHQIFRFPYTYSNSLFSNSFSKEKFYKDVFSLAAKELSIKIEEQDIYATGLLTTPQIPYEAKKASSLLDKISKDALFVSGFIIATQGDCNSFFSYVEQDPNINFRANLDLYRNIVYYDSRDIMLKDSLLRSILNLSSLNILNDTLVITGERFTELYLNPSIGYLLVLDILKRPGSFYIKLDTQNLYAHTHLHDFGNVEYLSLGTVINMPGKVECLIESDLGTKQLFDLKEDEIFIVPLESGETARVLAKSSTHRLEKVVNGGTLGIVFDTRAKEKQTTFKEIYLSSLNQYLNRI